MNDYWNNPPDHPEPPEWYMTLEDILNEMNPPQSVAQLIRKAIDDWVDEHNKDQHTYLFALDTGARLFYDQDYEKNNIKKGSDNNC